MNDGYLESKREDIADCDREILTLLRKRLDLAIEIGRYKAEHGLEVINQSVEQKVMDRYRNIAEEVGLDIEYVENLARLIIDESVSKENALQNKN